MSDTKVKTERDIFIEQADRIAALESQLAEARAEVERCKVDAERYVWLRDQTTDDGIAIVMKNKHINDAISYADNIDGYIDAARSKPCE